MNTCPKCQAEVPNNAACCNVCGALLKTHTAAHTEIKERTGLEVTGSWFIVLSIAAIVSLVFLYDTSVIAGSAGRVVNLSHMDERTLLVQCSLAAMLLGGLLIVAGRLDRLRRS